MVECCQDWLVLKGSEFQTGQLQKDMLAGEHLFPPCVQSCAVLAGSGREFEPLFFQLPFLGMLSCIVTVCIPVTWLTVQVQVALSCHIAVTHPLLGSGSMQ